MSRTRSGGSDAESRFFDNYLNCLTKEGIPETQRSWYVKRLEAFISAHEGRKIKSLSERDIADYFSEIGRTNHLADWQFRQWVDAIRILYCEHLRLPVGQQVDWGYWFDSAKSLEADHPSVGRHLTPEELTYFKERKGQGRLKAVRVEHRDLLVRLAAEIRRRAYAYRTEQSYEQWTCRFILFCGGASPTQVGATEVRAFLEYLAVNRRVSASTQNQALNALVFLYKQVLGRDLGELEAFARARRPRTLRVVISRSEVGALLAAMTGTHQLVATLLYGSGMRLLEGLRLRVQDVDFECQRVHVVQGKGHKDRYVPLPARLVDRLREQIDVARDLHARDLAAGYGEVRLPDALARKYPNAGRELMWQYLFPSARLAIDPLGGAIRRHHLHESSIQKAVKRAAAACGLNKRVGCHTLRHSFATQLLEANYDIQTVQELLGHRSSRITTHYSAAELGRLIEAANSVAEQRRQPGLVVLRRLRAV